MPKDKYFPFLRTYALFLLFVFSSALAWCLPANAPKSRPTGPRDTLTFKNGDTLQGKLDREVSGTVYFQSDELGEINVPWSKIQSLHTQAGYVVLENKPGVRIRHATIDASRGALSVGSNEISVSPGDAPPPLRAHDANARAAHGGTIVSRGSEPIPVGDAQYILDERTFNRQLRENPDIFAGWNGSATAGVTLVQGTENQYTYTSAIALVRTVPTVDWLVTRNRMSADFSSSYGKITQPAYRSGGALIPRRTPRRPFSMPTPSATSTFPTGLTGLRKQRSIITFRRDWTCNKSTVSALALPRLNARHSNLISKRLFNTRSRFLLRLLPEQTRILSVPRYPALTRSSCRRAPHSTSRLPMCLLLMLPTPTQPMRPTR